VRSPPEEVKMKFLIVAPDRTSREGMARLLHSAGHSAIPLQDGQQGLQALAVGHYDCVVTDLAMPVVDGLEMVRRMRFSADNTPVVICADNISEAVRATGATLGVAAFVVRPIAAEPLLAQLTAAASHTSPALA
jgi:DNA-binding response OmpR family regulator